METQGDSDVLPEFTVQEGPPVQVRDDLRGTDGETEGGNGRHLERNERVEVRRNHTPPS